MEDCDCGYFSPWGDWLDVVRNWSKKVSQPGMIFSLWYYDKWFTFLVKKNKLKVSFLKVGLWNLDKTLPV